MGDDLFPPTAEIILPLGERPIFEQAMVEIRVADDDSVSRVVFLCDGRIDSINFTTIIPYYQYLWNCSSLNEGQHTLQIAAYDRQDKTGLSSAVVLRKVDIAQLPVMDTLRYFTFGEERDLLDWKLPPDSSSNTDGYGVRFTPDRPCKLRRVFTKIKRKAAWESGRLWLEVYNFENGKPDSILNRKTISYRSMGDPTDFITWDSKGYGDAGIALNGEFFIAVVPADNLNGDTLAVQTDGGLWNNGHGYARIDSSWRTLHGARFRILNPMIYAVVSYD
ncbi:MAG: hypothetical protein FJY65_07640 [Calditrichaeota bacterium]|nr:hypothetical protein [Calditrichota bacterium]